MNMSSFSQAFLDECHNNYEGFYCQKSQSCFDQSAGCGFFSCYDIVFKHSEGFTYFSVLLFLYILLISYTLYHFGIYITYLRKSDKRSLHFCEKLLYYIFLFISTSLRILYCYFNVACLDNFRFVNMLADIPLLFFIFSFLLVAIIYFRILNDYQDIEDRDCFKNFTAIIYITSILLFSAYALLEIYLEYGEATDLNFGNTKQNVIVIIQSIIQFLSWIIFIVAMMLLIRKAKDISHLPESISSKILAFTIIASFAFILRLIFRIFFFEILNIKYKEIQNTDALHSNYELFLLGYYILVDIAPIVLSLLFSSLEDAEGESKSSLKENLKLSRSTLQNNQLN